MNGEGALLTLPQLLATGTGLLAVITGSSWVLLRQEKEMKQLHARIDTIATPYARASSLKVKSRRESDETGGSRALSKVARLFGYDATRASHYPVKAPVVAFATLVVSLVLSQIATSVVGEAARLAIPALWVFLSRRTFKSFEARRASRLYNQFPDALAMIVRSVRVGIPVSEAVRNVSREALEPTAAEFLILSDQLAIGVALDEALRDVAQRNNLPEYRFFATALTLQAQTGGGLSETLENLADVIRKRVAVRKRAYALASEARTSTYILAALPVFTGAALGLINPAYISLLFTDSTGNAVLGTAVGMLTTGMWVMRTTISRSLR